MSVPTLGDRRVTGQLSPGVRRMAARFAELACPPQVLEPGRVDGLLGEFEAMLAAMPPVARRLVPLALVLFDQSARLYPNARGRRFIRMRGGAAEGYFRAALARSGALQRVKSLIVMCYYELPAVKADLGYAPDTYIAAVSRRRRILRNADPDRRAADTRSASGPGHAGRCDLRPAGGLRSRDHRLGCGRRHDGGGAR